VENLVSTIRDREAEVRHCYSHTSRLSNDDYVKMILLDASFIIIFFLELCVEEYLMESLRQPYNIFAMFDGYCIEWHMVAWKSTSFLYYWGIIQPCICISLKLPFLHSAYLYIIFWVWVSHSNKKNKKKNQLYSIFKDSISKSGWHVYS
jgi:hypothetical protein